MTRLRRARLVTAIEKYYDIRGVSAALRVECPLEARQGRLSDDRASVRIFSQAIVNSPCHGITETLDTQCYETPGNGHRTAESELRGI